MTTADVIYWRGRCMEAEALAHYRSFENSFLRAAIPDGTPIPDIGPPPFQPYEARIAELQAKLEKATSIAERWENGTIKQLQGRAAALAETCAKIAETVGIPYGPWQREASQDNFDTGARYARMYIAGAIRALAANQTPAGKGDDDGSANLDRNRSSDGLRANVADVLTPSPTPGSPSAGLVEAEKALVAARKEIVYRLKGNETLVKSSVSVTVIDDALAKIKSALAATDNPNA